MQKARRHGIAPLRPLVSARFQVLFHPVIHGTFHLSLTVLVHYRSLVVLSLTRWSSQIHTEFHVLHATWDTIRLFQFSNTRLSLSMVEYSKLILLIVTFNH